MDYFFKYLSTDDPNKSETDADTIEKLVDRISTSTLIDDRRDAVRALKSLSKKFRLEVGTQAMYPILNLLASEKNDSEIVLYVIETLYNIMNEDIIEDEIDTKRLVNIPTGLGCQFTEMFINKSENIDLILLFIEDTDFHIRRLAIQLIQVCLTNMHKETQDCLLKCPMSISKIIDLLSDPREVIRNDSLLLLIDLVRGNTNIQKIVAFENTYDKLLTIISEEGDSDGGVIVEDCLKAILYLIENNPQNQTLFKEGSFINRLAPFFEFKPEEDSEAEKGWSAQKLANVQLMLAVVRSLVSPHNKSQATFACQTAIRNSDLFANICDILMSSGVPAQLLTETVLTVAEIMRGCQPNQDLFCQLMAPSQPPQPAINVLLLSMVNEGQSFILRCSVLYCFQCFLHKNYSGQEFIISTLLPKTSEIKNSDLYSSGKLLCVGLLSPHALSTWFAAVSIMHSINNNVHLKEEMLKVQLATGTNSNPVSLLQRCCLLLNQSILPQAKIGILMLLCTWLSNCPNAVSKFIMGDDSSYNKNSISLSYLMSELAGVEGDEYSIITRGLSAMLLGICIKYNNNELPGTDQKSILQLVERRVDIDVFIECLNQITKSESYTKAMRHLQPRFNKTSDLIFDYEFTRLFRSLEHEVLQTIQQLTETDSADSIAKRMPQFTEHENVVMQYKDLIKHQDCELHVLRADIEKLTTEKNMQKEKINKLQLELQITKDQHALLKAKNPSSTSISTLSDSFLVVDNVSNDHHSNSRIVSLENQLGESNKEIEQLKLKLQEASQSENYKIQFKLFETELNELRNGNSKLQKDLEYFELVKKELDELRVEHSSLKSEHDDLLVLLSDQEEKIREFKSKFGIEESDLEDQDNTEENVD